MGGEGVVSKAAKAGVVSMVRVWCVMRGNWASVSEPHTCDFNATFSLYIYIYIYIYLYATVTVLLTLRSIFRYFI